MFVAIGAFIKLLSAAGVILVTERHEGYDWGFGSWDEMVEFCTDLFRLTKASK